MHVMILGRCSTSLLPIRYVPEISKQVASGYSKNFSLLDNNILTLKIQNSKRHSPLVTLSILSSRMASTSSDSKGGNSSTKHPTNKLILEKSPYLLQHATNPVEWYPWGEEAFEKAKREDKLIFLSVGYSTCHWCHVMERESFEDPEIAKVMNKYFVNIKVDREERPDIDRIYMTFVQMISGHGGWPMSVFLTPDLAPVTGGTYFPPTDKYGQPGFKNVLLGIAGKWLTSKEDILKSGKTILEVLKRSSQEHRESTEVEVPPETFGRICAKKLADRYDEEFGGFSDAPKFPQPVNLNLLFHIYAADPSNELGKLCLNMCTYTLTKMANGGIHDHVGQGFSRYSVDGKWHVPHFEKMLYDQGQLLKSYADAFAITKDPFYADIADDIVTYVTRDLRHSEGGFYSAEDADSLPTHDSASKREGAFYVWTHDEIQTLLHDEIGNDLRLSDIFSHHFSVKPKGNVERYQDPHGELSGKNVLIVYGSLRETAEKFQLSAEETKEHLQKSLRILLAARSERPRPHLDDKIVTSWNGLMISGLSRAGVVLGKRQYIDYAVDAAKFIERHLYDDSKQILLRSCYKGDQSTITQTSVPIEGFLADYAFVIRGFLDLYEASFESHWLEFAEKMQDVQDKLFWDSKNAGYFATTDDNPTVIVRLKDDQDGAEPSGNSVACGNLLKLSSYLEREDLKDKAARLLSSFREPIMRVPLAFPELITALLHYHDTTTRIYVVGKKDSDDTRKLLRVAQERLIPGKILLLADDEHRDGILFRKSQVMGKMKPLQGFATAYVCRHHTCSLPVTNPEELGKLLDEKQLDTSL